MIFLLFCPDKQKRHLCHNHFRSHHRKPYSVDLKENWQYQHCPCLKCQTPQEREQSGCHPIIQCGKEGRPVNGNHRKQERKRAYHKCPLRQFHKPLILAYKDRCYRLRQNFRQHKHAHGKNPNDNITFFSNPFDSK